MSDQFTKILIVDDDQILRSLVAAKLRATSIEVIEASDGFEAWNIIKTGVVRLALVDVQMPHMNGLTLVQCVRSHPTTRHIPIVMVTSRDDHQTLQRALEAGATSYLTKPINWSLFAPHIEHLLRLGEEAEVTSARNRQLDHTVSACAAMLESTHAWLREWPRKSAAAARAEGASAALTNMLSNQRRQMLRVAKWTGVAAQCVLQEPARFAFSEIFRRPGLDTAAGGATFALSKTTGQVMLVGHEPAMEILVETVLDIAHQCAQTAIVPVDMVAGSQSAALKFLLPPMPFDANASQPSAQTPASDNTEFDCAIAIIEHIAALHGGHTTIAAVEGGTTELTVNLPLEIVHLRASSNVAEGAIAATA
jgi:DNA-binding response OmpR family regulator